MKLIIQNNRIAAIATDDYDGADWVPAPENFDTLLLDEYRVVDGALSIPVPSAVTPRQARLALLGAGLLAQVEAGLAAIPDAAQRQAAQIEWEYATTVVRDSQWVRTLGASLNLTSAQLDALFIAAGKL